MTAVRFILRSFRSLNASRSDTSTTRTFPHHPQANTAPSKLDEDQVWVMFRNCNKFRNISVTLSTSAKATGSQPELYQIFTRMREARAVRDLMEPLEDRCFCSALRIMARRW